MVERISPEKNDCIAASATKPHTMSVGIFSTIPVLKKLMRIGTKKIRLSVSRTVAIAEKN